MTNRLDPWASRTRLQRTGWVLITALAGPAAVAQSDGASFTFVSFPGFFNGLNGVSGDGTVAAGVTGSSYNYDAMVVTNGNAAALPRVPAGVSSDALSISGDGTVIAGRAGLVRNGAIRAVAWTRNNGAWTGAILNDENGDPTGDLVGGGVSSQPWAVSGDGSVIVGEAQSADGTEAFRWTAATGMVGLGELSGGSFFSRAHDISADGAVIVGDSHGANGTEAFRWTAASGMVGLGDFPGGATASGAFGISGNGQVVVGETGVPDRIEDGKLIKGGRVPASWTQAGGWRDLGPLPEGEAESSRGGVALDTSFDGSVIVGNTQMVGDSNVFVWSEASGMRSLHQLLLDAGVTDAQGWQLQNSASISDDGRTIVGSGVSPIGSIEAYIATLPASFLGGGAGPSGDYNNSGLVEQGDLDQVLQNWGQSVASLPASWVNQRPTSGIVDQAELDGVLTNWGASAAPDFRKSSVPEPAAAVGWLVVGIIAGSRRRIWTRDRVGRCFGVASNDGSAKP